MMDDRERVQDATSEHDETADGTAEAPVDAGEAARLLQEWQAKADDYLDKYRRSAAELANYRKRQEREREQERLRMRMDLFAQILPVEDDLQRAIGLLNEQDARAGWAEGVTLIERKLAKILAGAGVTPIEALGKPFDPHYHSAVMRIESDVYGEGIVTSELQRGYRMDDAVLRPTMVAVSSGPGPRGAKESRTQASSGEEE
jgi:molecular chaperone GrpE